MNSFREMDMRAPFLNSFYGANIPIQKKHSKKHLRKGLYHPSSMNEDTAAQSGDMTCPKF